MAPISYLIGLCAAMFFGAFIAGSAPLLFTLTEASLTLISTFGSGLLVGTAFAVILPEGVHTIYSASHETGASTAHSHSEHPGKVDIQRGEPIATVVKSLGSTPTPEDYGQPYNKPYGDVVIAPAPADLIPSTESIKSANAADIIPAPIPKPTRHGSALDGHVNRTTDSGSNLVERQLITKEEDNIQAKRDVLKRAVERRLLSDRIDLDRRHSAKPSKQGETFEPEKYIGPPLVLGFLFMLLIDQIGSAHDHSHQRSGLPHHRPHNLGNGVEEKSGVGSDSNLRSSSSSATLGLVVHAAADGIALGAALSSDQNNLGLIVFLAIMLHKAPSAFGLTAHLLRTMDNSTRGGISTRARIRSHLFLFSISAPIGTILTFCILEQLGFEDSGSMQVYTGLALLFSAGTFLYVATVHVLPEIYGSHHGKLSRAQLIALISAMFIPYFMTVDHGH